MGSGTGPVDDDVDRNSRPIADGVEGDLLPERPSALNLIDTKDSETSDGVMKVTFFPEGLETFFGDSRFPKADPEAPCAMSSGIAAIPCSLRLL